MIALYSDKATDLKVSFNFLGGYNATGLTATVKANGKTYSIASVSNGTKSVTIPNTDFTGKTDGTIFEVVISVSDSSGNAVTGAKEFGYLCKSTASVVPNLSDGISIPLQADFKVPSIGTSGGSSSSSASWPSIVNVLPDNDTDTSDEIEAVCGVRYNFPKDTVSQLTDGITIKLPMPSTGATWSNVRMIDFRFDGTGLSSGSVSVTFSPAGSASSTFSGCGVIDYGKTAFSTAVFNGTNWDVSWSQGASTVLSTDE